MLTLCPFNCEKAFGGFLLEKYPEGQGSVSFRHCSTAFSSALRTDTLQELHPFGPTLFSGPVHPSMQLE